jgi:hypothetical protein
MMEDDDIIIDQAMEANKRELNRTEGDIEMVKIFQKFF